MGNATCTGWMEETRECVQTNCTHWSPWEQWTVCQRHDDDCGIGGTRMRQRIGDCVTLRGIEYGCDQR